MQPREALNLLDQGVAQLSATRDVHVRLQSALAVLNSLVLRAEAEVNNVAQNVENAAKKAVEGAEGEKPSEQPAAPEVPSEQPMPPAPDQPDTQTGVEQ